MLFVVAALPLILISFLQSGCKGTWCSESLDLASVSVKGAPAPGLMWRSVGKATCGSDSQLCSHTPPPPPAAQAVLTVSKAAMTLMERESQSTWLPVRACAATTQRAACAAAKE